MALHPGTWQLAEHRRVRAFGAGEAMFGPAHSGQGQAGPRGGRLGEASQPGSRQGGRAVHHR